MQPNRMYTHNPDYKIQQLQTSIIDIDDFRCNGTANRELTKKFKEAIDAIGCAPCPLVVWEEKRDFDTHYRMVASVRNASLLYAICDFAYTEKSANRVTVIVAPSEEMAEMIDAATLLGTLRS